MQHLIVPSLIALGLVLIFIETIMPGIVIGLSGLACIVGSIVVGFHLYGVDTGFKILLGEVVGMVILFAIWVRYFPHSKLGQMLSLKGTNTDTSLEASREKLIGQTGKVTSPCRPSGVAEINGQRLDVVSESTFIEAGQSVKIVAVEGIRVIVRPVEPSS